MQPVYLFIFVSFAFGKEGEEISYNYGGDDWEGLCQTGTKQSPIDVHFAQATPFSGNIAIQGCELSAAFESSNPFYNAGHFVLNRAGQPQSTFKFGQSDGVHITNVGPEIVWLFDEDFSTLEIPIEGHELSGVLHDNNKFLNLPQLLRGDLVEDQQAEFVNFHVHCPSEHMYNGFLAPMEGHFVMKIPQKQLDTCPQAGCLSVVSVLFLHDENDTPNPFIEKTLQMIGGQWPMEIGKTIKVQGTLDFDELMPANPRYMLYEGSLTTPPCTEGVLWHVLQDTLYVSSDQVRLLQNAIGATHNGTTRNNRRIQPRNERQLIYHNCI
eukprot:TRINITY_DN5564_c0_g1_i10.p2 TRINITY_DN5564_c0_g1~~TRINITY_DN5564_c0_g1_i10.p2  ORF type:complete len:324 (+),score=56.92 TRINITY_DN5564_c0_g1_i10:72-1043(+)